MNAKNLTSTDWQHIISLIDEGYISGEIHSLQKDNKILDGWWFLNDEGIVVKFS